MDHHIGSLPRTEQPHQDIGRERLMKEAFPEIHIEPVYFSFPAYPCHGDSGSGLIAWNMDMNRYELVGIMSENVFHDIDAARAITDSWAKPILDDMPDDWFCSEIVGGKKLKTVVTTATNLHSTSPKSTDWKTYIQTIVDGHIGSTVAYDTPIDKLHCNVNDMDKTHEEMIRTLPLCHSDESITYQILRGCFQYYTPGQNPIAQIYDVCPMGTTPCRYGGYDVYLGCE